jgi:hypothetical protein
MITATKRYSPAFFLIGFVGLIFFGCALTPEQKVERAKADIASRPFSEWPYLYEKLENEGVISSACRQQWMVAWNAENAKREKARLAYEKEAKQLIAEQKRLWNSLTPAQKLDFQMRQQELENQRALIAQQQANLAYQAEADRNARIAAAFAYLGNGIQQAGNNYQNTMQNYQMINAYENRTRVLSQPVDVNLNGNINHTFKSY